MSVLAPILILEAIEQSKKSKTDLLAVYFQFLRLNILGDAGPTSSKSKSYVEMAVWCHYIVQLRAHSACASLKIV